MSQDRPQTEEDLVALVRSIDVEAPPALRASVDALIADRSAARAPARGRLRWLPGWGLAGGLAAAAVILALVAGLGGSGSSGPSPALRATSALTLSPATMAAPAESPHNRRQLAAAVDGVAFPYWEHSFGWRSVGARSDQIGTRAVTTVFYLDAQGRRIGYSIVSGTPPPSASGGKVYKSDGTPYRLVTLNGAKAVVWLRDGRLCVVSGRGVPGTTLLRLASSGERTTAA